MTGCQGAEAIDLSASLRAATVSWLRSYAKGSAALQSSQDTTQDRENYVRLEIAADLRKGKIYPYANFEHRQAGLMAASRGLKIDDGASYLRLRRRGDEIQGAFSLDGDHWRPFLPMIATFGDRVEVGVLAVNSSSKPMKAEFDRFQVITVAVAQAHAGTDSPPAPAP